MQFDTVPASAPILKIEHSTKASESRSFKVKSLPDKRFWSDLKKLYIYGCANREKKSFICAHLRNPANYTDLTLFELPDTSEFKHMDQNLLNHLMRADELLNFQPDFEINVESLFPFILYGQNESVKKRMPSTVKNAYRFVLCLYIDTILVDKNLNLTYFQSGRANDENITQKLKYFIIRIASKVYDDYTRMLNLWQNDILSVTTTEKPIEKIGSISNSSKYFLDESDSEEISSWTGQTVQKHGNMFESSVTPKTITAIALVSENDEQNDDHMQLSTTIKQVTNLDSILETEPIEESCLLEVLPDTPLNSYISEIKMDNETIFKTPDRLYLIGPVSVRTRAYFVCSDGYRVKSKSVHYFECNESSKWSGSPIECEGNS